MKFPECASDDYMLKAQVSVCIHSFNKNAFESDLDLHTVQYVSFHSQATSV